jgi:hypothetical protein
MARARPGSGPAGSMGASLRLGLSRAMQPESRVGRDEFITASSRVRRGLVVRSPAPLRVSGDVRVWRAAVLVLDARQEVAVGSA